MAMSWFTGKCKICSYEVVVTQPNKDNHHIDYLWYCSNKECENHAGQHTLEGYYPTWVSLGLDKAP